jgi:HK97 gp10 family phage protein
MIKLKLSGFDELLKQIEDAGQSIDSACESCMNQSANIMYNELKTQMRNTHVKGSLINRMPQPELEKEGNAFIARVGYEKGDFDPKNLSDGYKAVFINFGTPKITPRQFVKLAKKKAAPQIKKAQKETLEKILERAKK